MLTTSDTVPVSLKSVRDRKPIHIARIRVSVSILNDEEVARESIAEATSEESNIDSRLHPDTLLGKVWQLLGKLDALSEIISKIDQLAKVCLRALYLFLHYLDMH